MQAKVLVDDMKGPLEDGDHIITWRNSIVSNLSITAIVTVGNPEDMKPAPVEVVGVTDGYGGYGNPPPASSYAKAQPAKIAIGGELDASIAFLAKYEAVMCGTPERDIVEEWQLYLHRYLRKIMINSENNATFTLFLDRCDELPHIYGELKLTRNIMDMIPHALPEWYFRFIWLVTKAANPVTRAEISTTTNYGQLLVDIPNEELDFITQYFASVAVVSF